MNKRALGAKEEKRAAVYLKEKGFQILETNYRSHSGEIDMIAREKEYLVFVEVKYRSSHRMGLPEEAVDLRKQRVICKVAVCYLLTRGYSMSSPCRFDVVAMDDEGIRLYRNAFSYVE